MSAEGKTVCTDDHWHHLWAEFNRQTRYDTVKVDSAALADVLRCTGERTPPDLVQRAGRTYTHVNRPQLFELLRSHGRACGKLVSDPELGFVDKHYRL